MSATATDKIIVIELPPCINREAADELLQSSKDWLQSPVELFAFNFEKTLEFKQSCYRQVLTICQQIRKSGKNLVSFNLTESLERQVRVDGISDALNLTENYDQFVAKIYQPKCSSLDVRIINPFLSATINTLEKQANTKCEAQKPQFISVDEKATTDNFAIAGIIALNTEQFNGSITLAFPEVVFLAIYESMFGEKVNSITPEIEDTAAELLNIIYGSAKTTLNESCGFRLAPALPTILSGEKIKIRQKTYQKIIILPFKTQFGFFQIEVSFDPQR